MKSRVSLAAFTALLLVPLLVAADQPEYPKPVQKTLYADDVRGKPAPKFAVAQWLTDEPDRRGKVVLIDFWATWCPPCRATIPELNTFQAKFKDDLAVIGVSDETTDVLKAFMARTEMKYSVATDPDGRMKGAINVSGIPHVLIIFHRRNRALQGFPLSDQELLTEAIVKQVIDADPGVAARHAAAGGNVARPEKP